MKRIKSILLVIPSGSATATYTYTKGREKDIEFTEGEKVTMMDIQVISNVDRDATIRFYKQQSNKDIIEHTPLVYIKSRELLTDDNMVRNISFPISRKEYFRCDLTLDTVPTSDVVVLLVFQYE